MTVIHLDGLTRDCQRCGFTLPVQSFRPSPHGGRGRSHTCGECAPGERLFARIAALAADMTLRVVAARALLRLGCPRAAVVVLAGEKPWPKLGQARAMQRRSAP